MTIEALSKAYVAENLAGSCFTAPLRTYNSCLQNLVQTATNSCERTAWKICHLVSGLFAYPTLGLLALMGIGINMCLIPPENGYSLWARWNKVPDATETFCNKIRQELLLASQANIEGFSASQEGSSSRSYTYSLHKQLSFDIQNIFEEDRHNASRVESHIHSIQAVVRKLSEQQSWYPEHQCIKTVHGRVTVYIPIPDHITLS